MKNSKSCLFKNSTRQFLKIPNINDEKLEKFEKKGKKEITLREGEIYKQPGFLCDYEIDKKLKTLKETVIKENNFLDNYNKSINKINKITSARNTGSNFYRTRSDFSKPLLSTGTNFHTTNGFSEPFLTNIKTSKASKEARIAPTNKYSDNQNNPNLKYSEISNPFRKVYYDRYGNISKSSREIQEGNSKIQNLHNLQNLNNFQDSNKNSDHTSLVESTLKFEKIESSSLKKLKSAHKTRLKRLTSYDNLDPKVSNQNYFYNTHNKDNNHNSNLVIDNIEELKNSNKYNNKESIKSYKEKTEEIPLQISEIKNRPKTQQQRLSLPTEIRSKTEKVLSLENIDKEFNDFANKANLDINNIGVGNTPKKCLKYKSMKTPNAQYNIDDIEKEHRKIFNYDYEKLIKAIPKKRLHSQTDIDYDFPTVKKEFYFMKSTIDFIHGKYLLAKAKKLSVTYKHEDGNKFLQKNSFKR